jgi:hypothetical protein
MAGSGFHVYKRRAAGADVAEKLPSVASTTYVYGDMLTVIPASGMKGQAKKVAAADKGTHIYEGMVPQLEVYRNPADTSTAAQEPVLGTPVAGGLVEVKSYLTGDAVPLINRANANANSTATEVKVTAATSDNDYDGGTIYCPELDEQRQISDSQDTAGEVTFTVEPAFSRPVTTGDTVIAVPFGKGSTAVKFNATSPHQCLDTDPANKTGGHNKIEEVNLKGDIFGPYVISTCPDQE